MNYRYEFDAVSARPQLLNKSPNNAIILLVDDNPAVGEGLSRIVTLEGWQVVCTATGEETFGYLREHRSDLMIGDVCMMPVSSLDLYFYERIQQPNLPIFLISGFPSGETGGSDQSANALFPTPLDLEGLVLAMRQYVGVPPSIQPQWLLTSPD